MNPYCSAFIARRTVSLALPFLVAAAMPLAAAEFLVTDLGANYPTDINNHGTIVGNSPGGAFIQDGISRSLLFIKGTYWGSPAGGPPPTLYPMVTAAAINDAGQIAGSIQPVIALPTTQTAALTDGSGGGLFFSQSHTADAVNGQGQAAGGEGDTLFFNGSTTSIAGGEFPKVYALNDAAIGAGSIAPGFGQDRAATFAFPGGTPALLDLTAVVQNVYGPRPVFSSTATALNNAGQVVGNVRYAGGAPVPQPNPAFIVSGGSATNLGTLGGLSATAKDINNHGVVVGDSTLPDNTVHAFVHRNGTMTDLNSLIARSGWVLATAKAINDKGQIVGSGTLNGEAHGFLLTPIDAGAPQPPSIVEQPTGGQFALGGSATLKVTAVGTSPFTYVWSKDNTILTNATSDTLSLSALRGTDTGIYRVVITNSAGSATSADVTLSVLDPLLAAARYTVVKLTGEVGGRYLIEYLNRADDTVWKPLSTLTLTNSPQLYLDVESVTNAFRLYRSNRVL
jgi:probable HAF family extracellular repeat protein